MKFSIIIACYNLGELVCRAIESCLNQQIVNKIDYEIIAINDGSTDNTLEYIRSYVDAAPNLRIIDKPNAGLSNTRNVGIKEAKGDTILFLDGDDWFAPDTLETLIHYVDKHDIIDFPMVYYYDEDRKRVQDLGLVEGSYTKNQFLHLTFGKTRFDVIPSPKRAYNREFLLKNNICFIEGILHEDGPFFLDVMDKCDSVYELPKPLYYYLQNRDGSITSRQTIRNYKGIMQGITHIETLSIANNPDILLHIGHLIVYQVTQTYKDSNDYKQVCRELRTLKSKKRIMRCLCKGKFEFKQAARLLLLLIDPEVLGVLYR